MSAPSDENALPEVGPGTRRERKRKSDEITKNKFGASLGKEYTASTEAVMRLMVITLVVLGGLSDVKACEKVGVDYDALRRSSWKQRFEDEIEAGNDGFAAILEEHRGGKRASRTVFTPEIEEEVMRLADEEGLSAKQIHARLAEEAGADLNKDQQIPAARTIRKHLENSGYQYVQSRHPPLVKTPWAARWRLVFAIEWLDKLRAVPELCRRIIFSDEKKFSLAAEHRGHYVPRDKRRSRAAFNPARDQNMTDEQYRNFAANHPAEQLPATKARGLLPVFAWGAVAYNVKSDLFFLDDGDKLTRDKYQQIVGDRDRGLAKMLEANRAVFEQSKRPEDPVLYAMDNDPKHYSDRLVQLLRSMGVVLLGSRRPNEDRDGPDVQRAEFGRWKQYDKTYFPTYSPDINSPIEKVWHEMDRRILERVSAGEEIKTKEKMKQVILEVWNGLEFEKTDKWCGINFLVENTPEVLEAIIGESGWDTKYDK